MCVCVLVESAKLQIQLESFKISCPIHPARTVVRLVQHFWIFSNHQWHCNAISSMSRALFLTRPTESFEMKSTSFWLMKWRFSDLTAEFVNRLDRAPHFERSPAHSLTGESALPIWTRGIKWVDHVSYEHICFFHHRDLTERSVFLGPVCVKRCVNSFVKTRIVVVWKLKKFLSLANNLKASKLRNFWVRKSFTALRTFHFG